MTYKEILDICTKHIPHCKTKCKLYDTDNCRFSGKQQAKRRKKRETNNEKED